MMTLGIETSCDETSAAILRDGRQLLSNVISSSLFRHQPFGGVVPEIASRHSLEQIDTVFHAALKQAKVKVKDIDLITVTVGPGLIGSLLVGISFAKALSYQLKKPLVGVNHLDAHLTANFIGKKEPVKYIGLLVSGGHTSLSFHQKGKVKLLGSTVDDAVGEAYDKAAKLLELGYPGGPILDKLAQSGNAEAFPFTKPKQKGAFDFSYSGIKTAVLYLTQNKKSQTRGLNPKSIQSKVSSHPEQSEGSAFSKREKQILRQKAPQHDSREVPQAAFGADPFRPVYFDPKFVRDVAASFQKAAIGWLVEKTLAAAEIKKVRHIVVGGGVSANSLLRKRLMEEGRARGLEVLFPPMLLTMDNAGMIARRGYELYKQGRRNSLKLAGNANLKMGA